MKNLNFIVTWGTDKTRAWSGTYYSIHQALKNYYNIIDIPTIERGKISYLISRILCKLGLQKDDFNIKYILKNRNYYESKITGKTFQFTEFLKNTDNRQTYIYQDLSVPFLLNLAQTDRLNLTHSGFSSIFHEHLKRRCNLQMEYYQDASGIFFMGKWITKFMSDIFPSLKDKIHHVGAGINLDYRKIKPIAEKKNNKILFVGRDFTRKGGHKVIEAFKLLKKNISDLELHIAGPSIDPLNEPINGYYFYGDISYDNVQDLMNKCDIFCMPSYFEAYGLVFIEALAFGLPCIGRNCYEMPYLIEEGITGELVHTDETFELSEKILKILLNKEYRRNVYHRREYYLKEYSWDTVASRMACIIG